MSLMDRIKVKDFLSMDADEKESLITHIRALRVADISAAKTKRNGVTKSALKNKVKKAKKSNSSGGAPSKKIIDTVLARLTPEQLALLKEINT